MICCVHCFKDAEIKSMINSYNKKGICDLCGQDDVNIYDTTSDDYLIVLFEGLLDIYETVDKFEEDFPKNKLTSLKYELKMNWDIFEDNVTPYWIEAILKNICSEYFDSRKSLLTDTVGILNLADEDYLNANSIVGKYSWADFVISIKSKFRFHTDIFKKEILGKYCPYLERVLQQDQVLYRARISNKEGFATDKMGAPPKELVKAGRINPEGLNYLYLSDSRETTVYETRASLHDYVCIGEFRAVKDIKVIDLTGLDKISVFNPDLDYAFHAINRVHLKRINDEIAKPVRNSDSHLEYLPTQYICDYIKSIPLEIGSEELKYDGIMYKSTITNNSYNIAIFNPELFKCVTTEIKQINQVSYKY